MGVSERAAPPGVGDRHPRRSRVIVKPPSSKPSRPAARKKAARKAPKPLPAADKTPGTPRKKAAIAGPKAPRKGDARPAPERLDTLQGVILASLEGDKAEGVITLDLAGKATFCDRMVIATGLADRQISAMAEHLVEKLKDTGMKHVLVEGAGGSDWVLIDAGDIIVHLFKPEARSTYALEKMWGPDFDEAG